jgi:hypothetical protein
MNKRDWDNVDRDILLNTIVRQQDTIRHLKWLIILIVGFTLFAGLSPEGSYVSYSSGW